MSASHLVSKQEAEEAIQKLQMKERAVLVDDTLDDGNWTRPLPYNPTFTAVLFAVKELNDDIRKMSIYFEPTLNEEQQKKQYNVGVFEQKFGLWKVTLNWSADWKGAPPKQIPPRHMWIEFKGEPIGCLGPHLEVRACWACGLEEGFRDPGRTMPAVVPGEPCPRCYYLDWWGSLVKEDYLAKTARNEANREIASQHHLLMDAAEAVAVKTGQDHLFEGLRGEHAQAALKRSSRTKS